jgi:hypothetical protein
MLECSFIVGLVVGSLVLLLWTLVWMVRWTLPESHGWSFDTGVCANESDDPFIFGILGILVAAVALVAILLWVVIVPVALVLAVLYWCGKQVSRMLVNYKIEKVED